MGEPAGGWTHLIQCRQKRAEHERSEYDGDIVLGQDMGFAGFPSRAGLGFLFLRAGREGGRGLGLFFDAGHAPLLTVDYGRRGAGSGSRDILSGLK